MVRKLAGLAVALTTASLMTITISAPASAGVGTNYVMNFGLSYYYGFLKCIDTANGNYGTDATTWTCNRGDHKDWSPSVHFSDGSVAFRNKYFNMCLMADYAPYSNIPEYACTGGTLLQRWYPHLIGGSTYTYRNVARGLCLDVGGTSNGTRLVMRSCNGSLYQEWIIGYNGG